MFFGTVIISSCSLFPQMLPPQTIIKDAYANGQDEEQKFIQNLSLFLCVFLKEHGSLVEKKTEQSEIFLRVSGFWFYL